MCNRTDHLTQECPTTRDPYESQCNALGTYRKPYTPYSNTYNPGWRNHPNFSWNQESHQLSQTPQPRGYSTPQYATFVVPRNSLEDTMQAFMETQSKTNQKFESLIAQLAEDNNEIKSQISKLTNILSVNEQDKFPSQA